MEESRVGKVCVKSGIAKALWRQWRQWRWRPLSASAVASRARRFWWARGPLHAVCLLGYRGIVARPVPTTAQLRGWVVARAGRMRRAPLECGATAEFHGARLHCAYIYELIEWRPRRIDKFVQFPGKFLLPPLSGSTAFRDLGQTGAFSGQILQFFRGVQASARTFAIVSLECAALPDEAQARSFLASRVGGTQVELCSRVLWIGGELQQVGELASEFLRGSRSLLAGEFAEMGKLRVAADAKGLAVIDTTPTSLSPADRFMRVSQLVTLSCAYGSVLEALVRDLSAAGLGMGRAAEMALRDWSRFMSAYYFSEPVRQDTIELCRLYNAVKERQKLSVLAQEATEQLRLLAELVRLDRNEAQAGREKRVQMLLSALGLLLTAFGLLQAVQVTPKTVLEFRESWGACLKEIGLRGCALGERPAPLAEPIAAKPASRRAPAPARRASAGRAD
ncbi:MAG: hypothetical protein ABW005_03005 [Burkholderiaceae bacterium]